MLTSVNGRSLNSSLLRADNKTNKQLDNNLNAKRNLKAEEKSTAKALATENTKTSMLVKDQSQSENKLAAKAQISDLSMANEIMNHTLSQIQSKDSFSIFKMSPEFRGNVSRLLGEL